MRRNITSLLLFLLALLFKILCHRCHNWIYRQKVPVKRPEGVWENFFLPEKTGTKKKVFFWTRTFLFLISTCVRQTYVDFRKKKYSYMPLLLRVNFSYSLMASVMRHVFSNALKNIQLQRRFLLSLQKDFSHLEKHTC